MMATGRSSRRWKFEIVGLVKDSKYSEVKGDVPPLFFLPILQNERIGSLTFYIRTAVDPEAPGPTFPRPWREWIRIPVKRTAHASAADPRERVPRPLHQHHVGIVCHPRDRCSRRSASTACSPIPLSQRTRESGSGWRSVPRRRASAAMVLGQVTRMTIVGGIVGLSAAWGLSRLAQSLLYQMSGSDPIVLIGSAAALALVALAAGFVPALKASRVEPMRALRYE